MYCKWGWARQTSFRVDLFRLTETKKPFILHTEDIWFNLFSNSYSYKRLVIEQFESFLKGPPKWNGNIDMNAEIYLHIWINWFD